MSLLKSLMLTIMNLSRRKVKEKILIEEVQKVMKTRQMREERIMTVMVKMTSLA